MCETRQISINVLGVIRVKRFIYLLTGLLFLFSGGCSAKISSSPQETASPSAEVIDIRPLDISADASVDDIMPFYLPQKRSDGSDVRQPSLSITGDRATISSDGDILVELYYTQEMQDFPASGKAEITSQNGEYTLKIRLNSNTGCTLKSTGLSKDELIRIAESFCVNSGPPAQ